MIPALGVMIAAYIITRMMEMLSKAETKTTVKVFACITIIVTLVSVVDILNAGTRIPRI